MHIEEIERLAEVKNRQRHFEQKILNNLDQYQKKMLEMFEPCLTGIKDDKEWNNEKLALSIQGPESISLIKEEYVERRGREDEEDHPSEIRS